jgi:hypothetical protein
MKHARHWFGLLGLTLLVAGAAPAQTEYTVRPFVKVGEVTADVPIPTNQYLWIGGFSDRPSTIFSFWNPNNVQTGEHVFEYSDGKFTPIALPKGDSPDGKWPTNLYTQWWWMNRRGTALFTIINPRPSPNLGLYRWDAEARALSVELKKGMPASEGYTIEGLGVGHAINDLGDRAHALRVRDAAGQVGYGLFFVGRDGVWQPVLRPGQELPGGGKLRNASWLTPGLTNSGAVFVLARRENEKPFHAYIWEQGSLRLLLSPGGDAPGGGKITAISSVQLGETSSDVILTAGVENSRNHGIYRLVDGKLVPLLVPGQEMPGGGMFRTLRYTQEWSGVGAVITNGLGAPNLKGQRGLLATLEDGSVSAYLMEPDGKLSLLLKQGQQTALGTVTRVGQSATASNAAPPPYVNGKGEVLLLAEFDNGPRSLVLLEPKTP